MARRKRLRIQAIRVQQNPDHPIYLFALTAPELHSIADISRVSRDDAGQLIGYQRDEVRRHVQEIAEYIDGEQDGFLFPNSLIVALTSDVKFVRSRGPKVGDDGVARGVLEIPVPRKNEPRPGFIVDGQQRALAMAKAKRTFLCPVNAFIADEVDLQRDQFLRVNNTRPLPRGLITELLPEVTTQLPSKLSARKIPSAICNMLNEEESSPFRRLIRRTSTKQRDKKTAVVTDTAIIRMLEESLKSPSSCLFPYRNIATGETDFEGIWSLLVTYWTAVQNVFPDAWGKKPAKSRLMHGAGIRSMGRLMDRVMPSIRLGDQDAVYRAEEELRLISDHCFWTSGRWEELGGLRWNEIQNVPRHIRVLSNHLIRLYMQARSGALV